MRRLSAALWIVAPALATIVLASILISWRGKPALAQTGPPSCCGPQIVGEREVDFPYYSLVDGYSSSLNLVSVSPQSLNFVPVLYSMDGETLVGPSMTIDPGAKMAIDLRALLTTLHADPTGPFAQGNIAIYFEGTIMPLVGQVTMTNPAESLSTESEMVENDPGRSDIPPVLSGMWWDLGSGRNALVMVSNMSANMVTADVYLDFDGTRHQSADGPLCLHPHATKVLSVTQLLDDLNVSPSEAPEGGITIIQRGPNPNLIAQGRITDPVTGFSTTMQFPDPARQKASALEAVGLPIGSPSAGSPFYAGAGYFTPHVVLRNLSGAAQTATVTVEYPTSSNWNSTNWPGGPATPMVRHAGLIQKGQPDPGAAFSHANPDPATLTGEFTVASLPVGPYSTVDYSLGAAVASLPAAVPFCSVRIQYSGAPGTIIGEASSVESRQNLVVDAMMMNEGDGWAGSGANPWHLDANTDAVLFLTDEGSSPARIALSLTSGGTVYHVTSLKLAAHETRAINLRQLRDAQAADFKGDRIPAGAADGAVRWIRLDDVPVTGRLLVINKGAGLASSYDCCYCSCPASFSGMSVSPSGTCSTLPGQSAEYSATANYMNCNGSTDSYDVTGSATWTSYNTSVATVSSGGVVTAVAGGQAQIVATGSGTVYEYQCQPNTVTMGSGGYCDVDSLAYQVTENGIPGDPNGVLSDEPVTLQITASCPNSLSPDTGYNDQDVPFILINGNPNVGESVPSSVSFSEGVAQAAGIYIVLASGLTNSSRMIVLVSVDANGTIFYPNVYMAVFATDEGLTGRVTACGYTIPAGADMVALPYGKALCNAVVSVNNGSKSQQVLVEDVGPWCPNTPGPKNYNTCSCPADPYWIEEGVPDAVLLLGSCNSNGAGIDLGDGTYQTVRGGTNGAVQWDFP